MLIYDIAIMFRRNEWSGNNCNVCGYYSNL